jgi:hypothetical protein
MENVISKTFKQKTRKVPREAEGFSYSTPPKNFEEAMKDPFARKKHEDAVATLARCPIPEEILLWKKQQMNNSCY